ncbi:MULTISPECIES: acyltransferase family protein [Staphylococcus]|uniref:Acyltransferase family protein n=1 Tax=Staphylococcus hsinchuensis TaxID=3051183 RepID=A0ABZ3EEP4_9STAP|nr:acyltransferase family protein [Staphylococcus sp. Marseille-Q5304]
MQLSRVKRLYSHRYLPGLDGFRAIAVIAIIIFHLNAQWLPGGFLGVDTFFVISGYLITALLLSEYEREGSIDLIAFWKRRIKRLIPAVIFLLGVVLTYVVLFEPKLILDIKQDVVAAFFYVSNWWYIIQNVDYFNQFESAPLKHLWSLAIEEQFYLVYPIILLLLLKFAKRRETFFTLLIVSLISLLLMIILSHFNNGQSRVYFGTDTRLQTLLLGALLAMVWSPFSMKSNIPNSRRSLIDVLGALGFIGLIIMFFTTSSKAGWLYNGGFYIISFFTLFIIASAAHPSGWFAKLMGNKWFVYIGKRSYSLYLWHYPVITFVHSHFVDGQIPFYAYLLDLILMCLMTEFSYRFIEKPVRKHGIKAFAISPTKRKQFYRMAIAAILVVPTLLLFSGQFDAKGKKFQEHKQTSFNSTKSKDDKQSNKQKQGFEGQIKPMLIGDSVMVDIGKYFQKQVPNAKVDGKVGRQLTDANNLINSKYENYCKPNKDIVLELGTNGDFTEGQLNTLIKKCNGANIYLTTTRVPRKYEQHVNQLIHEAGKKHKNVHVVEWYKASEGHQEYFAKDGIHLQPIGSKALSNLIIKEIKKVHNAG